MQNTSNLRVAGLARGLAREVYRVTAAFPSSERYGLAGQMRRAAVSIGSNIAEECGRHGDRSLISFLQIAMGSASELEFQIELSLEIAMLPDAAGAPLLAKIQGVKRMLASLLASLRMQEAARDAAIKARDR